MTTKNKVKKIAFLGSKAIGLECLRILSDSQKKFNFKIVGILTTSSSSEIISFADSNNLSVINDLKDYNLLDEVDIAISVQYHKILPKESIEKAKEITVNLHMAPLPEYRGCNQFSYCIINEDNFFGTTIHKLEEGIDSGPILFEDRFSIPDKLWVNELYDMTFNRSVNLFEQSLPKILQNNYKLVKQDSFSDRSSSFHLRQEIVKLKEIDLDWSKEKIEKYIRATSMPGFSPPFFKIGNKEIPLGGKL